jgi:hypothetical protein
MFDVHDTTVVAQPFEQRTDRVDTGSVGQVDDRADAWRGGTRRAEVDDPIDGDSDGDPSMVEVPRVELQPCNTRQSDADR